MIPRLGMTSIGYASTAGFITTLDGGHASLLVQIGSDGEVPTALLLGSVQSIGYRSLPLFAIHLSPKFALEFHAAWSLPTSGAEYSDRYLGGFAWEF